MQRSICNRKARQRRKKTTTNKTNINKNKVLPQFQLLDENLTVPVRILSRSVHKKNPSQANIGRKRHLEIQVVVVWWIKVKFLLSSPSCCAGMLLCLALPCLAHQLKRKIRKKSVCWNEEKHKILFVGEVRLGQMLIVEHCRYENKRGAVKV